MIIGIVAGNNTSRIVESSKGLVDGNTYHGFETIQQFLDKAKLTNIRLDRMVVLELPTNTADNFVQLDRSPAVRELVYIAPETGISLFFQTVESPLSVAIKTTSVNANLLKEVYQASIQSLRSKHMPSHPVASSSVVVEESPEPMDSFSLAAAGMQRLDTGFLDADQGTGRDIDYSPTPTSFPGYVPSESIFPFVPVGTKVVISLGTDGTVASSFAAAQAVHLQEKGHVLYADLQSGQSHGLGSLVEDFSRFNPSISRGILVPDSDNLTIATNGVSSDTTSEDVDEVIRTFISFPKYDYLVVDMTSDKLGCLPRFAEEFPQEMSIFVPFQDIDRVIDLYLDPSLPREVQDVLLGYSWPHPGSAPSYSLPYIVWDRVDFSGRFAHLA